MKTWIKRSLVGVAAVTVLIGGMAACSERHHRGHGWQAMSEQDASEFKAEMIDRVGRKLELDAEQKAKLGLLADRLREQRNALVGTTTDPRAELQSLVAGTSFDRAKAEALVSAKTDALRGKAPEVIAALADFYDSLKPEQQAEVRELMARGKRWGRS